VKEGQKFDIQERTFKFAVRVVKLVNRLPRLVPLPGSESANRLSGQQRPLGLTWKRLTRLSPSKILSIRRALLTRRRGRPATGCVSFKQPCSTMMKSGL